MVPHGHWKASGDVPQASDSLSEPVEMPSMGQLHSHHEQHRWERAMTTIGGGPATDLPMVNLAMENPAPPS